MKKRALETVPKPSFEHFLAQTLGFELHGWQAKHLVPLLESLAKGSGKRILIHAPPQFGKSILVSKRFPAWALGMSPKARIVLAGYNLEHAAAFAEVVRDVMAGDNFRNMFPNPTSRVLKPAGREAFSTRARHRLGDGQESVTAVGLLSGFTGRGADILIIDDPYASPDDARSHAINERVWRWWNELARVRINDKSNVLVMFHRYHEDDFAGRLLAQGGWEYYRFPAIADDNEDGYDPTGRQPGDLLSPMRSEEFLRAIEENDPVTWIGQFQGRPRPPEGAFIRREWLHEIPASLVPPLGLWVRFWDLASKADQRSDFTAGALVGVGPDQTVYVKDVVRFRAEWPDARDIIAATTEKDAALAKELCCKYEVGLEFVAWMRPMMQDLFTLPVFQHIHLTPTKLSGDKKERASAWVARAKNDRFRMVKDHWNQDFIAECLAFDGLGSTHDDQIDAVSGAFDLLWSLKGNLTEHTPGVQVGSYQFYKDLVAANRSFEDECFWYSQRRERERDCGIDDDEGCEGDDPNFWLNRWLYDPY